MIGVVEDGRIVFVVFGCVVVAFIFIVFIGVADVFMIVVSASE